MLLLGCIAVSAVAVPPSASPPGGLDPANTPQFILFTHDDAITAETYDLVRSVTDDRQSLDGCPAVATMFTTISDNECELQVDLYNSGFEIADHTISHVSLLDASQSKLTKEILEARTELAACGIPAADIVGLRAPFLETDPAVRQMMYDNGFLYESTLIEEGTGASLTEGMDSRVWPFTMEAGIPMNCDWFSNTQKCNKQESYPGMFQVPVWQLMDSAGTPYSMDYGSSGKRVYDILKDNFDAAYGGNRAPLPIYIHTPWLANKDNLEDVQKFADYALSQPDTYFVTIRQLLAWMQNTIPADQLTPQSLGCGNAGGAGGTGFAGPTPAPSPAAAPRAAMPEAVPAASTADEQTPAANDTTATATTTGSGNVGGDKSNDVYAAYAALIAGRMAAP